MIKDKLIDLCKFVGWLVLSPFYNVYLFFKNLISSFSEFRRPKNLFWIFVVLTTMGVKRNSIFMIILSCIGILICLFIHLYRVGDYNVFWKKIDKKENK